jgi:hypothetical protein
MPDARDSELLNHIRSYGQTPPPPPECQFNHWGLTVYLAPELAKQFEPPADPPAFAEFMERMLRHCRVFMSAYPGTRGENPHKVLQAFIHHFLTPSPDNPIPNYQRYGHKGHGQPYPIWFLKCFCNFLKEHYPAAGQAQDVPLLPPRSAVDPFGPATPPSSSPPKVDKVVPLHSERPHAVPERPRPERPQRTRANPFRQPEEAQFALKENKLSLNDGEEPADPPRNPPTEIRL